MTYDSLASSIGEVFGDYRLTEWHAGYIVVESLSMPRPLVITRTSYLRAAGSTDETIVAVACVSKKQDGPAPAEDLYVSAWFKKAREFAEREGSRWFILSALHGLIEPSKEIKTYNVTLNKMPKVIRTNWALLVSSAVDKVKPLTEGTPINWVVLAGQRYRSAFERSDASWNAPLEGLTLAYQLSWLKKYNEQDHAQAADALAQIVAVPTA